MEPTEIERGSHPNIFLLCAGSSSESCLQMDPDAKYQVDLVQYSHLRGPIQVLSKHVMWKPKNNTDKDTENDRFFSFQTVT